MAFASPGGARLATIPTDPLHLAIDVAVFALVAFVGLFALEPGPRPVRAARPARAGAVWIAVAPLVFVLLPWLPAPIPAVFLIWTGALTSILWVAALLGIVAVWWSGWHSTSLSPPRVHARAAFACALVVFSLAAWRVSPVLPGGDEPHYLVITQSLLYDHDLKIENNHRRGDYRAYFAGDLQPDFIRRGRNGEIYSIHAPGVPAIVLPAFALGGYRGVVIFLLLVSAAATSLAWWLGWRVSGSVSAAWFGWAAVTLSAPFLTEAFTVYPDGLGGIVVLTGVWALLRADWEAESRTESVWPWVLHGAALALLPWMHTRFAVLAATLGGLILVRLARTQNAVGKAIAFLAVPAASALGWLFFFVVIYGTPDPSAPYGRAVDNSFQYFFDGIGGLLFDQGFGLFATAPVLALALAGFARQRRLAAELAVVAAPYILAVATFAMWWAGTSGPARFMVPLVLVLAIPAASAWRGAEGRPWMRTLLFASLVVSCWISVLATAGGGRLAYHARNAQGVTAAPWFDAGNDLVDVPSAMPGFVPLPVGSAVGARRTAAAAGFEITAVWLLCLGASAAGLWLVVRRRPRVYVRVSAGAVAGALGVMAACGVVWSWTDAHPESDAAGQLALLRSASSRTVAVDLTAHHVLPASAIAGRLRIAVPVSAGRAARRGGPLAVFPLVPAGVYDLRVKADGADGWLMVGVGADQFAIVTQPVGAFANGIRVRLPVDVRALIVRSDEAARDDVQDVELTPVTVAGGGGAPGALARRAARYGAETVFFLDDGLYPEPGGFWTRGERETSFVVLPDDAGAALMTLRNGAVANTVTVTMAGQRQARQLAPGEELQVRVPPSAGGAWRGTSVSVESAAGFRPSETDPRSRDARFLGVYVRF